MDDALASVEPVGSAHGNGQEPPRPASRLGTIDPNLLDAARRLDNDLPAGEDDPVKVVVELNPLHLGGFPGAWDRFRGLYKRTRAGRGDRRTHPILISNAYVSCLLSIDELDFLLRRDREGRNAAGPSVERVWMDYRVRPLMDRALATLKADVAGQLFGADGSGITWAVVDSGIEREHPHFQLHRNLEDGVINWHRDFLGGFAPDASTALSALVDERGHGTHVAGIIAGGLPAKRRGQPSVPVRMGVRVPLGTFLADNGQLFDLAKLREFEAKLRQTQDMEGLRIGETVDPDLLSGVAPRCRLISLRVLDNKGNGRTSGVISALRYIREQLNIGSTFLVHGVNLSVGYDFNAKAFPCGASPLCVEVDRLVRSGVVVVAAAGNTGFGELAARTRATDTGLTTTINDPGNAELAITVGSVHRDSPHTYGISYFSSKGPTIDGRPKPDLVAPGERIVSCAAGRQREELMQRLFPGEAAGAGVAGYVDDSGTSMAAPHVSGAVAAFLSVHREFVGRASEVKRVFMDTATTLNREPYFQGRGLVDLMRAIQSV